ncbi:hypothetical protein MK489_18290 [Myxococcota bacterium]|nr:hypothetical protein [Myxococcota bacterium]
MSKIDRLGSMIGTLRQRVRETRGSPDSHAATGASSEVLSDSDDAGVETLRSRVIERLAAIPPEEPDHASRARRIFVESVLFHEFGATMSDDPRFSELVDRVCDQIDTDESFQSQFDSMIDELSSPPK